MNIKELCNEGFIDTLVWYEKNISELDDWFSWKWETTILVNADDIIEDYYELFWEEWDRDFEQCEVTKEILQNYKWKTLFLQIKKTWAINKTITAKTVEQKQKIIYVYTDAEWNEIF